FFHFHSESASGHDALADSTAKADPGIFAPKDSISSKHGMDEGTKNCSFDHIFTGSNPNVLVDKTKSPGDGLKIAHTTSDANEESRADDISQKIKKLKQHVRDMEIELLEDLLEIPTKLESFTSTISIQVKLKTLDSLPSLLHKVTDTLNWFATMVENAFGATSINVPSASQATASPTAGVKNTKDADTNLRDELVDLLGNNVVTQYYTKKLLFDKYYDKMLKRKKSPKIINCEVLIKKGPITLKIYREDRSDEVISNLKVSDLHLAE
ncbi:hypothetical protein Tco_1395943, partial [Tanacetum coccineum]